MPKMPRPYRPCPGIAKTVTAPALCRAEQELDRVSADRPIAVLLSADIEAGLPARLMGGLAMNGQQRPIVSFIVSGPDSDYRAITHAMNPATGVVVGTSADKARGASIRNQWVRPPFLPGGLPAGRVELGAGDRLVAKALAAIAGPHRRPNRFMQGFGRPPQPSCLGCLPTAGGHCSQPRQNFRRSRGPCRAAERG